MLRRREEMGKHELIIYEQHCCRTLLNIYEVSRFVGLHPDMIHRFIMLGLIDPQVETPDMLFEDSVVSRIGKIMRLKSDLGVNLAGCGLILDLLDRIEAMEKRLVYYQLKYDELERDPGSRTGGDQGI